MESFHSSLATKTAGFGSEATPRPVWFILAACSLCYFAQSFTAWGWPALDGYPAIERWLDPDFLLSDFYTNTTARYGVDTWQGYLFGGFERWTGVNYAVSIAVLTALRQLALPWLLYTLLRALLRDNTAAVLGVVCGVLGIFEFPRTVAWSWLWGDGSPALFAIFLATAGWVLLLGRRVWQSLLLLAVAAIVQPLVAIHGGIVFFLVYVLDFDTKERLQAIKSPANIVAGAVLVAAVLSQYMLLSPSPGERLPDADYVHILAWERHPTDFLPSRFDRKTIAAFLVAFVAVIIMFVKLWPGLPRRVLIAGTLFTYCLICIVGSIFVEWIPVRVAADLIPFRTVMIATPMMLAIIGAGAARLYRDGDLIALGMLFAAFVLAGPASRLVEMPYVVPAGLLLIVTVVKFRTSIRLSQWPQVAPIVWPVTCTGLLAIAATAGYLRWPLMQVPTLQGSHPLYAWARSSSEPSAKFLVEQFASESAYHRVLTPQHMRLLGRRAVVASMDYPFADRDLRPWLVTWAVALDHGAYNRVERAGLPELLSICRQLPYDFVVRVTPVSALLPIASFPPSHGLGTVYVYSPCATVH